MAQNNPQHRSPPRAEPIQPDRPWRGDDQQRGDSGAAPATGQQGGTAEGARKLKQQSEDAVANTREGYGGGD
jgi:hypothetical protein